MPNVNSSTYCCLTLHLKAANSMMPHHHTHLVQAVAVRVVGVEKGAAVVKVAAEGAVMVGWFGQV